MIEKKSGDTYVIGRETEEGLYEADLTVVGTTAALVSASNRIELWHRRLGHVSKNILQYSETHVDGIETKDVSGEDTICRNYRLGKATRKPRKLRPTENSGAKGPADRVYTDIAASIRHPSIGGAKYFVTLMDEYSGLSMVLLLKQNQERGMQLRK